MPGRAQTAGPRIIGSADRTSGSCVDELLFIPRQVPLLPLPEVVLFPRAVMPLRIFEPRYRQLVGDVLAGERILAAALLKPGFEPHYHTLHAPIHPIIGVGQIVASEQVEDGNYKVLLRGVIRARIVAEVPHEPYRIARITALRNAEGGPAPQSQDARTALRALIASEMPGADEVQQYWLKLLDTGLELGDVADLIASGLPLEGELRQCLLAELDPVARTQLLLEHLRTLVAVTRIRRTQSPGAEWKMN